MKVFDLSKMFRGWFVGPFEPTVFPIKEAEVAIKRYVAGDYEASHHHKLATEITVIVSGRVEMNGIEYGPDSIIVIEPNESTDFHCLTDVVTTVVKCPYVQGDKYLD